MRSAVSFSPRGGVSALDNKLVGASAGRGLVAVSDHGRTAAIVGGHHRGVVRCRDGAGALNRNIGWDAGDDGSGVVVDGNRLGEAAGIAAGISSSIGALEDEFIGASEQSILGMGNGAHGPRAIAGRRERP